MTNDQIKQAFREYIAKENQMCKKLKCYCCDCPAEDLCLISYDLDDLLNEIDTVLNWQSKMDWNKGRR